MSRQKFGSWTAKTPEGNALNLAQRHKGNKRTDAVGKLRMAYRLKE